MFELIHIARVRNVGPPAARLSDRGLIKSPSKDDSFNAVPAWNSRPVRSNGTSNWRWCSGPLSCPAPKALACSQNCAAQFRGSKSVAARTARRSLYTNWSWILNNSRRLLCVSRSHPSKQWQALSSASEGQGPTGNMQARYRRWAQMLGVVDSVSVQ